MRPLLHRVITPRPNGPGTQIKWVKLRDFEDPIKENGDIASLKSMAIV